MDTNPFLWPYPKMSPPELTSWLQDSATLQEAHPFHRANWCDWAPGALKFRQHAEALDEASKAAASKEPGAVKKRDQEFADTLASIYLNACYIVIRARAANDESVFHNCGYTIKEKTGKNAPISISVLPLVVKVTTSGPGAVRVSYARDAAAGLYHIQLCKGTPTGEDSWVDGGLHKGCRPTISGLDRASWYYFRVSSHGDNVNGPWSAPVGIIVV